MHDYGANSFQSGLEGDSTLDLDQEKSSETECLYSMYALYQLDPLQLHHFAFDFHCYLLPKSIAVFTPATMALTCIRSVAPILSRYSIVAKRSSIVILDCGANSRSCSAS